MANATGVVVKIESGRVYSDKVRRATVRIEHPKDSYLTENITIMDPEGKLGLNQIVSFEITGGSFVTETN